MTVLADLSARATSRRRELDRQSGLAAAAVREAQELMTEVAGLAAARESADRVAGVLASLGTARDAAARAQVEQLVSAGLSAIFAGDDEIDGETLTFHLIEGTHGSSPTLDFIVRTHLVDGTEIDTDVLTARGGGMAAVVGLLLRVVLILLTRASGARAPSLLVLDETLAMLSREYLDRAGQFLQTLSRSSGVQIVMVTHSVELAEYADVAYRFRLDSEGRTVVVREGC